MGYGTDDACICDTLLLTHSFISLSKHFVVASHQLVKQLLAMMSHPITVNDEIDWKTFEKECKKQGINFQYQRYLEEGDKKIILQKIICCIREHLPNEFVVDASPPLQHRSKLDKLVAETELARGFLAIREIIQPKLIVRLPKALVLQVQAEMNRQSSSYLSAPWATSTSSSSSLSSSSFPPLSSAPSSSQSSSHLAVGFVGATGSTSQAKKLAMKRKIKRDEDPPLSAPYVKKEDYENGPREDEELELDPNPKKNCGTTPYCLIKPSDRDILWVI
ncbi:hypothetical protein L3Y34_013654 [Caenorhabditis briggsae]|uniref:Uncharacterized protein n=1 Tax=Caenorhabditis briggsae TaxID=6238 RepID=A0AAE9A259_CAEBR|nr:hypothetical protein L3Y34_013654 [Caenorhabditis briggsae]